MRELNKILDDAISSTSLNLSVYDEADNLVFGGGALHALPAGESLYEDKENGVTVFKFVYSSDDYYGVIPALGEEGKNYAAMLFKIIDSSLSRFSRVEKKEYLRRILSGEASSDEVAAYRKKYSLPDGGCYVIAASAEKHIGEIENLFSQAVVSRADCVLHVDDTSCALIKFSSEDEDYRSAAEYSEFLAKSVFQEIGVHPIIGVGGIVPSFSEISSSYEQAFTAVKMCRTFSSKGDVHTYKEYLFIKMLDGIPESRKKEYISEFLDEKGAELFEDGEMTGTAEEFLSNSLNISETSRNLYMHRNTLMYRLDKIEKVTGLNIRKFPDAVSFRVLTILYTLLK